MGNVLGSAAFPVKAEAKLSLAGARLCSQVYRSCLQLSLSSTSRCHTEEEEAWQKLAELSFIAQYWSHLFG